MLVDGRFPAGGHTNSAGVEAAVRIGDVHHDASLERYLRGRLATTGVVDAAFAAHTAGLRTEQHERPEQQERPERPEQHEVASIDGEYSARVMSPALRDASRRFGRQMLRAGRVVWRSPLIDSLHGVHGGAHQPMVVGALVAAAGGTPVEAAATSMHHLSAAVTSAAIRLLGLDPMSVATVQARVGVETDRLIAGEVESWVGCSPAELPAGGGSLTEILGESHATWDARLFVA